MFHNVLQLGSLRHQLLRRHRHGRGRIGQNHNVNRVLDCTATILSDDVHVGDSDAVPGNAQQSGEVRSNVIAVEGAGRHGYTD